MSEFWRAKVFHGPVDEVESEFDEWLQSRTRLGSCPFICRNADGPLLMNHSIHATETGIATLSVYALMGDYA